MRHLLAQWRKLASGRNWLVDALQEQSGVDVARTLFDPELATPSDLEFELDLDREPSWDEIEEARQYVQKRSQDALRGLGSPITVYRGGAVYAGVPMPTSLSRQTAENHSSFKGRDGSVEAYEIDVSDVLLYSEALWPHGYFAEEEVVVMGDVLERRRVLSSWRKLTAKRMYHGTPFEFQPGDILEGGKGEPQWDYGDIGMNVVWMHDNPETARLYGEHVYEVEPLDWLDNYSEEAGHDDLAPGRQEWISPKVRVVRRVS